MEVFDVYSTDNLQSFLKAKTAEGWEVVGTVSRTEAAENVPVIDCLEFQWNKPIILVIGSEGDGLSLETQRLCHRMLVVPPGRALCPGIESLNVSVATGILLHSICSQKVKPAPDEGQRQSSHPPKSTQVRTGLKRSSAHALSSGFVHRLSVQPKKSHSVKPSAASP
uniref:tRNA/rRNA methyltransferase SpoU type domain-containing protein n=1 Tax=Apteryx owenii TaxID=8824 RepID=A0A8B9PUE3_APTOW